MPAHDGHCLARGPLHRRGRSIADGAACRRGLAGHGGASASDRVLGLGSLGRGLVAQFPGLSGYLVLRRTGLAAQVGLDLRGLALRPLLHVGLCGQGLDGFAELLPGALDLLGEGFLLWYAAARGVFAHRRALSLICSTSALTLSVAWLGTGGVALLSWPFPASTAMPAAANSATPMISAASHGRSTPPRAMIAAASRHPTP